jgi:hypothetical protein
MIQRFLFISFLFLFCINTASAYRFYCGLSLCGGKNSHYVKWKENAWRKGVLGFYQAGLEQFLEDKLSAFKAYILEGNFEGKAPTTTLIDQSKLLSWALKGTPFDIFNRLLDNIPQEIHHFQSYTLRGEGTLGVWLARQKNILLTLEITGGFSPEQLHQEHKQVLFQQTVPEPVQRIANTSTAIDAAFNPLKDPLLPWIYFDGAITISYQIKLQKSWYLRNQLRLGTLFQDRLYIFASLGAESHRLLLFYENTLDSHTPLNFYGMAPAGVAGTGDLPPVRVVNSPISSSQAHFPEELKIESHRFNFGITGSLGGELFVTQKFSLRLDFGYLYCPDVEFRTQDGKDRILCSDSCWRIECGTFWRF